MQKHIEITKQTERAKGFFEDKLAFTLGPVELKNIMNEGYIKIIDVRKPNDYNKAHIKGAISIPAEQIESKMNELSKDNINIIYCYNQQCHLAARCALKLAENGYPVMELEGGFARWYELDFEVTTS